MKGARGMEQFIDWVERMLSLIFVPATFYGGAGAFMRVGRRSRTLGQIVFEVFGGVVTSHMLADSIYAQVPFEYQSICFFLAGWGGLELVGRLYEAVASGLESRVKSKIDGNNRE